MTLPYALRLICLCLACFFAVHLATGLAAGLCVRPALFLVLRRKPRTAARVLLALRLLPAFAGSITVVVLCAPSYLWLEPRAADEEISFAFLAAACGGGAIWAASLARVFAAGFRSLRYLRHCRRAATPGNLFGVPVWISDSHAPQMVLAGIFRPALVVSRGIVNALAPEQLEVALRHERAHWTGRDNLKRLLLLLAPGMFPFSRVLDRAWAHVAEWAADDRAVAGDRVRAVSLASALVSVARIGAAEATHRLATSLLADTRGLAERVDRLLAANPPADEPASARAIWLTAAAILALAPLCLMARPAALATAHTLLERLAH